MPLQQSNKDYEGGGLLHNYLSLVIFILILKPRDPLKKGRKRMEVVKGVKEVLLVLPVKNSSCFYLI